MHFSLAAEPLSRLLSDRPERPTLEEPVQDAGTLWQKRVWLLPTLLHSPTGYQAAEEGLGGWRQQAEMDRQTGTVTLLELLWNYFLRFLTLTCCRFSHLACICSWNWHSGHSQVEPNATQETTPRAEVSWKTLEHILFLVEGGFWSVKRCGLYFCRYLHKPYLISGNKFDLRIYVYVTSYDPLRVYIFNDGLVRFASCKWVYVIQQSI